MKPYDGYLKPWVPAIVDLSRGGLKNRDIAKELISRGVPSHETSTNIGYFYNYESDKISRISCLIRHILNSLQKPKPKPLRSQRREKIQHWWPERQFREFESELNPIDGSESHG